MKMEERRALLNNKRDRLREKLKNLAQRERQLNAKENYQSRKALERARYQLGGIVQAVMAKLEVGDYSQSEIAGALLSAFSDGSMLSVYAVAGDSLLKVSRLENMQSASAQGFTQAEVAREIKLTD